MDSIIDSESVPEEELAWWTRVGELGTKLGLREIGCSEETIAETLSHLGATEEFTPSESLSGVARAVVCATVGRGISSSVKKFKLELKAFHNEGVWTDVDASKELSALCVNLKSNINIKEVDLSGDVGTHPRFLLLVTALKSNSAIQALDLSSCNIGTEGARCLMEGLKSNNTVRSLNLGFNQLQDEGIETVAEFLTTNVSLKRLDLESTTSSWSATESTTGATRLGSALERNITLEHLSLRNTYFSRNDMKRLFQSLSREVGNEASSLENPMNTTLKHLDLFEPPSLHSIANPSQVEFIASMIRTNKSLAYLDLGGRTLSPTDWKGQIFAALKENKTLEELGLSSCSGLSEDVGEDLMNLLLFSGTRLRKINLSHSDIKHRQGQVDEELRVNAQYRRQLRGQIQVQTTSGRLVLCGYEFAGWP